MKHQYFGDIGDYQKYSLLRTLALQGDFRLLVCWMLTENDNRTDGKFIQYLNAPQLWRQYDETVFDFLARRVLGEHQRHVGSLETHGFLPNTTYYSRLVADDRVSRQQYFDELRPLAAQAEIVFFDPDNGLEVKSVGLGKRGSSKYLYWHEAAAIYAGGSSVLIYQHYRRENREQFVRAQAAELLRHTTAPLVVSIRTTRTAYLWALQPEQHSRVVTCLRALEERWGKHLTIGVHKALSAGE